MRLCSVDECGRPHKSRGYCASHYMRVRRTGSAGLAAIASAEPRAQSERFWEKVDVRGPDECWLWTAAVNEHGYGVLRPAGERTGRTIKAHRYSAELAGMDIRGRSVLHACDNPPCVNPAHLRPGTQAENSRDMAERGRSTRGERSSTAKLTEADVREIRERRKAGEMMHVIAEAFGTSTTNVDHIVKLRTWKHVA